MKHYYTVLPQEKVDWVGSATFKADDFSQNWYWELELIFNLRE